MGEGESGKEVIDGQEVEYSGRWSDHVSRSVSQGLQEMVNSLPFGASAMSITGLGTDRLRLKLRIMSDEDLWWLFLSHREECSHEFWEELENRKAAGTLSKDSPFWTMSSPAIYRHPRGSGDNSNLIELTHEEWEARRRRKMFRLISA